MSLRLKFLLSLLAVLAVLAGPALYAVNRVAALRDLVLELRGQAAQSALAVGRLEAALLQVDRYQRAYVASPDPAGAALVHQGVAEAGVALRTLHAAGYTDLVVAAGISAERLSESTAQLELLVGRGQLEEATSYLIDEAVPRVVRARAALPALAAAIDRHTGARVPGAQRSASIAATATTAALLLGLALALALSLAAARVLTRPLERLSRAMARVADDSLDTPATESFDASRDHVFDAPRGHAFDALAGSDYDRADEVGELARSFRFMTTRLTELDRLKAEFVGAVSHDLKTPISVIVGYAELMHDELDGSLDARPRELLRSLSAQTRTLQHRVDRLLEISRMESGRLRLDLEQIDLRHFAEDVRREFEPAARMRGIRIELSVHDGTPAFITADPDVLRTDIVGNLMRNALESTPAGGIIRVTLRPDGHLISLEIADTGTGMARGQLLRHFERYYAGRDAAGRAGFGLAIARSGIEHHGGRIEAQSRIGGGARFCVTLPASARASALGTSA